MERLTVVTHNIFFGGTKPDGMLDYLDIHWKMNRTMPEDYAEERVTTNQENPVDTLLDSLHIPPDILSIQELMPHLNRNAIERLQSIYGGGAITMGETTYIPSPYTKATVLASKYRGECRALELPGNAGGGACELYLPTLNLSVIAVHPTAFNLFLRPKQLRTIYQRAERRLQEGEEVLVMGDFNTENVTHFVQNLNFQQVTRPSFPSNTLMQKPALFRLMVFPYGQRCIDHILLPKSWTIENYAAIETTSDHHALIVQASLS